MEINADDVVEAEVFAWGYGPLRQMRGSWVIFGNEFSIQRDVTSCFNFIFVLILYHNTAIQYDLCARLPSSTLCHVDCAKHAPVAR